MEPSIIVVLGGILPFGSIFIEMYAHKMFAFWHSFTHFIEHLHVVL